MCVRQMLTLNQGDDAYLSLRALATYSGISLRQLRCYLARAPLPRDPRAPLPPPLPHYRLGRRLVVRKSEFDQWMAAYQARPTEARELAATLRKMMGVDTSVRTEVTSRA